MVKCSNYLNYYCVIRNCLKFSRKTNITNYCHIVQKLNKQLIVFKLQKTTPIVNPLHTKILCTTQCKKKQFIITINNPFF